MAETKENPRVQNLMSWVRMILPITIAGLGWYIGQTVNGLENRLTDIETKSANHELEFASHRASAEQNLIEINRRLSKNELTLSDMVELTEFMSRSGSIDRRLDRIEDRLNEIKE